MKREILQPKENDKREASDREELFHDFIVNYVIHHPVYKLNKDFSKHIDKCIEEMEIAKTKIWK